MQIKQVRPHLCWFTVQNNTLQLTVVMAELKIASMNVRGIGNNNKRRETFNWLRNKQQSIIFLQEVHCTEATIDTWRSEWGYKALFSCFSGSSAGVCILFNNNFKFDILKTFSDPPDVILYAILRLTKNFSP